MTLDTLNNVLGQLTSQMQAVLQQVNPEKPVIQHCNAIELLGAMQLCRQLIQQEEILVKSPPGATGPNIP